MTKMCNQIAIAGVVQGLSEALHFAEKAGLDGRAVVEVISQGAAGSWQMANRYETMLDDEFEHGFAVDWMRKDLGICLDTSDEIDASLPLTALVDQFYKDVQKLGAGVGIPPALSSVCARWANQTAWYLGAAQMMWRRAKTTRDKPQDRLQSKWLGFGARAPNTVMLRPRS